MLNNWLLVKLVWEYTFHHFVDLTNHGKVSCKWTLHLQESTGSNTEKLRNTCYKCFIKIDNSQDNTCTRVSLRQNCRPDRYFAAPVDVRYGKKTRAV